MRLTLSSRRFRCAMIVLEHGACVVFCRHEQSLLLVQMRPPTFLRVRAWLPASVRTVPGDCTPCAGDGAYKVCVAPVSWVLCQGTGTAKACSASKSLITVVHSRHSSSLSKRLQTNELRVKRPVEVQSLMVELLTQWEALCPMKPQV